MVKATSSPRTATSPSRRGAEGAGGEGVAADSRSRSSFPATRSTRSTSTRRITWGPRRAPTAPTGCWPKRCVAAGRTALARYGRPRQAVPGPDPAASEGGLVMQNLMYADEVRPFSEVGVEPAEVKDQELRWRSRSSSKILHRRVQAGEVRRRRAQARAGADPAQGRRAGEPGRRAGEAADPDHRSDGGAESVAGRKGLAAAKESGGDGADERKPRSGPRASPGGEEGVFPSSAPFPAALLGAASPLAASDAFSASIRSMIWVCGFAGSSTWISCPSTLRWICSCTRLRTSSSYFSGLNSSVEICWMNLLAPAPAPGP